MTNSAYITVLICTSLDSCDIVVLNLLQRWLYSTVVLDLSGLTDNFFSSTLAVTQKLLVCTSRLAVQFSSGGNPYCICWSYCLLGFSFDYG